MWSRPGKFVVGAALVWIVALAAHAVAADEPAPMPLLIPDSAADSPLVGSLADLPRPAEQLSGNVELIQERYADGRIKVEREVVLDDQMNYVNHGAYTMYDPGGNKIRTGQYRNGLQHGKWTARLTALQGEAFADLSKQFAAPFLSEATFVDGKLQGAWTIADAKGRRIVDWQFDAGRLNGKTTWWHPNGEKKSEIDYNHGVPRGEYLAWGPDKRPVTKASFVDGRLLLAKTEWYAPGNKRSEGSYLVAPTSEPQFDWWTGTVRSVRIGAGVPNQKHGPWTFWHRNGQKQMEGTFHVDVPAGAFTWWYENGQPQAKGQFDEGVKAGTWTTWHVNGMKESQTQYKSGTLTGKWMRWEAGGKLVEVRDFSEETPQGNVVHKNAPKDDDSQVSDDGFFQDGPRPVVPEPPR